MPACYFIIASTVSHFVFFNIFLQIHHLTTNPGCEMTVFRQLLFLSSHEGLGLPIRAPDPDHMTQSAMSLNTITDAADEGNDVMWEDIRSRLRRYFLERIKRLPILNSRGGVDLRQNERVEYLQSLCILYPEKKIWGSYQLVRSQQVTTLIQDLLNPSYSDEVSQCLVVPGPKVKELPKQKNMLNNFLLSRNQQDTTYKLCIQHCILANNPVLVSMIVLCFAPFVLE